MDQQELINAYLDGKLSEGDRKLFEKLIDENPEYKSQLEQQKSRNIADKGHPSNSPSAIENPQSSPKKPKTTSLKSWVFSATVAVCLVAIGYFLWTTLSMSPSEKLYLKYYEPLNRQKLKIASRGNSSGIIEKAFEAYDQGDFKKAAELFEEFKTQPGSDYFLLFHGICQLELDRPEKAIPIFNLILVDSNTTFKEVAAWYAALGYFKLNMLEKGIIPLQIAAAKANPFQEEAKKILETLR